MNPQLAKKRVKELFVACQFAKDEIINGRPNSEVSVITEEKPGHKTKEIVFSTEKLNANKSEIIELLDLFEREIPFGEGALDRAGAKWDASTLQKLCYMGTLCNSLQLIQIEGEGERLIDIINSTRQVFCRNQSGDDIPAQGRPPFLLDPQARSKEELINRIRDNIGILKKWLPMLGFDIEINGIDLEIYSKGSRIITTETKKLPAAAKNYFEHLSLTDCGGFLARIMNGNIGFL